jgi:hypothetical protein
MNFDGFPLRGYLARMQAGAMELIHDRPQSSLPSAMAGSPDGNGDRKGMGR